MLICYHDLDNIYFIAISVYENHRVDIFFQDSNLISFLDIAWNRILRNDCLICIFYANLLFWS